MIDGDSASWGNEPLARLIEQDQLAVYRHRGYWQNMSTLRREGSPAEAVGPRPWRREAARVSRPASQHPTNNIARPFACAERSHVGLNAAMLKGDRQLAASKADAVASQSECEAVQFIVMPIQRWSCRGSSGATHASLSSTLQSAPCAPEHSQRCSRNFGNSRPHRRRSMATGVCSFSRNDARKFDASSRPTN
jgi:hypothetical protein